MISMNGPEPGTDVADQFLTMQSNCSEVCRSADENDDDITLQFLEEKSSKDYFDALEADISAEDDGGEDEDDEYLDDFESDEG